MRKKEKRKGKLKKGLLKRIFKWIVILAILGVCFGIISNILIVRAGKRKLVGDAELAALNADCVMVLGAGIWRDNEPSPMLRDRLDEGIRIYNEGIAPKILVSGDHELKGYDEVNVMKTYLLEAGIPSEDIFMDHAGLCTYDSMYRAKAVFGVERMIVVTQEYHEYRALYICKHQKIDALGSPAAHFDYSGQRRRDVREWLARDKDILTCLFRVKPKYLGEPIDIHGDGNVTIG